MKQSLLVTCIIIILTKCILNGHTFLSRSLFWTVRIMEFSRHGYYCRVSLVTVNDLIQEIPFLPSLQKGKVRTLRVSTSNVLVPLCLHSSFFLHSCDSILEDFKRKNIVVRGTEKNNNRTYSNYSLCTDLFLTVIVHKMFRFVSFCLVL